MNQNIGLNNRSKDIYEKLFLHISFNHLFLHSLFKFRYYLAIDIKNMSIYVNLHNNKQRYLDKFGTGCEHFYTKFCKYRLYQKEHKNDTIQEVIELIT